MDRFFRLRLFSTFSGKISICRIISSYLISYLFNLRSINVPTEVRWARRVIGEFGGLAVARLARVATITVPLLIVIYFVGFGLWNLFRMT